MLIDIDLKIYAQDDSHVLSEIHINSLINLSIAWREGKHIVTGSRETLDYIRNNAKLSPKQRGCFDHMYKDTTVHGALKSQLLRHIEAVAGLSLPELKHFGDKKTIRLPLEFFHDSETIQKTVLLTENVNDQLLYGIMLSVFMCSKNISGSYCSHEPIGGGGSTTQNPYKTYQNSMNRLCLCILDSDRKFPKGPIGNTARSVKDIDVDDKPHTELMILDSREIENLIPTKLLKEMPSQNHSFGESIVRLELIEESNSGWLRNFLDFKKGTKLGKILLLGHNTDEYKAWKDYFDTIDLNTINKNCINSKSCMKNESNNNCECFISLPFCEGILGMSCEHLDSMSPEKIMECLCKYTKPEWEKIGGLIFAWCFAGPKRSVI